MSSQAAANRLHDDPLITAVAALAYVDPNCSRDDWAKIIMACKSGDDSESMRSIVEDWSRRGDSYNQRDFDSSWRSIKSEGRTKTVNFATLIYEAKKAGWPGPERDNDNGNGAISRPVKSTGNGARQQNKSAKTSADNSKKWLWSTPEIAAVKFEKLPLAREHAAARELLENDYGLPGDSATNDMRVLLHPWKSNAPGIVYRANSENGSVYKWRSLARDSAGKRDVAFLHGAGGFQIGRVDDRDAPLVIGAGEEKFCAALLVGCHALFFLTGEKGIKAEMAAEIVLMNPSRVIFAGDADENWNQGKR